MHDMENEPLDNRVPIIERHKEIDLTLLSSLFI